MEKTGPGQSAKSTICKVDCATGSVAPKLILNVAFHTLTLFRQFSETCYSCTTLLCYKTHFFELKVDTEVYYSIILSQHGLEKRMSSLETSTFEELRSELINFACNCVINALRLIVYLTGFSIRI